MPGKLLLRVASAWPLPGLGLLLLPAGAAPELAGYALHSALLVRLELPAGTLTATATVEEISREQAVGRGLLLGETALTAVPPDTAVWLVAPVADPWAS